MSTAALTLAAPKHLAALEALVIARNAEAGRNAPDMEAAVVPLLHGSPLGAAWMIGPQSAPVGYLLVGFGWSIEAGGMTATLADVYTRPGVRRRGIALSALTGLAAALRDAEVCALLAAPETGNEAAQGLFTRAGLSDRPGARLMGRNL